MYLNNDIEFILLDTIYIKERGRDMEEGKDKEWEVFTEPCQNTVILVESRGIWWNKIGRKACYFSHSDVLLF